MNSISIYIDGSFTTKNPEVVGWAFITEDGTMMESGKLEAPGLIAMRQVSGELKAAMMATAYAKNNNYDRLNILYDYEGVEKWVTGMWNAKKPVTQKYKEYMCNSKKKIEIIFKKVSAGNNIADEFAREITGAQDRH